MSQAPRSAVTLAGLVTAERAALVATMIRLTGDWDLAEDCVQDAIERALSRWPIDGVPRAPGAWLTTTARNRALDVLRRRQTERAKLQQVALLEAPIERESVDPLDDDRLRLIFTCCHPALALDSRVALTLKTVAGLSMAEIARAFLISEATLSQRLLRVKRKVTNAGIPYRVPPDDMLAERLDGVLAVLYLIYNEGYGRANARLADEAVRLGRLLVDLMPIEDEARGLLALMLMQESRRGSRFDAEGELVPIEQQDRTAWDRRLIDEAGRLLRRNSGTVGAYRLQAEIAHCHAIASAADTTPWTRIVQLYDALLIARPSPVIALNRAVAVGFRDGFLAGLAALDAVDGLDGYALLPAARADFLRRLDRRTDAVAAYRLAITQSTNEAERSFLARRLAALEND